MRTLVLAAALATASSAAGAAVYTYEYQGNPFTCRGLLPGDSGYGCWIDPTTQPPWTATLTIDERRFPGGTLAGASFGFAHYPWSQDGTGNEPHHEFWTTSPNGSSSTVRQTPLVNGKPVTVNDLGFLRLDGALALFMSPDSSTGNFLTLVFDANRQISLSYGANGDGGSSDQHHSPWFGDWAHHGDYTRPCTREPGEKSKLDGICAEPGSWTLVSVTPSAVPLPAGVLLLAGALGLLGLTRRSTAA